MPQFFFPSSPFQEKNGVFLTPFFYHYGQFSLSLSLSPPSPRNELLVVVVSVRRGGGRTRGREIGIASFFSRPRNRSEQGERELKDTSIYNTTAVAVAYPTTTTTSSFSRMNHHITRKVCCTCYQKKNHLLNTVC